MGNQEFITDINGNRIFTFSHTKEENSEAVIMFSGLGNSIAEPRYFFPELAGELFEKNFDVYLFDYYGQGDSDGDFSNQSYTSLVTSAILLLHRLKQKKYSLIHGIGYGIGNWVIQDCHGENFLDSMVLINQSTLSFITDKDELQKKIEPVKDKDIIYPEEEYTSIFFKKLWDNTIGEPLIPTQPCAPLHSSIIFDLYHRHKDFTFSDITIPALIFSEENEICREKSHLSHSAIDHRESKFKPSWHWCARCRGHISSSIVEWLTAKKEVPFKEHEKNREKTRVVLDTENLSDDIVTSVEVTSSAGTIRGILEQPSKPVKNNLCIIYEVGLPGQRVDIHRFGPRLCRNVVKKGFSSFRFDTLGTGLSEGKFHKLTLSSKINDLHCVMDSLKSNYGFTDFILIGSSAGVKTSLHVSNHREDVRSSIMLGPILKEPEERVGEGKVTRLEDRSIVTEFCGLWLGIEYNIDEKNYNFIEDFKSLSKPFLIVFSTEDTKNLTYKSIKDSFEQKLEDTRNKVIVKEGPHGFSSKEIDTIIDLTTSWIEENTAV